MTEVQTYMVEEFKELVFDDAKNQEWKNSIEEFDLEGQKSLLSTEKEDSTPIPFQFMNKGMTAMFEILCPTKTLIEEFKESPIPLEALTVFGLSKKEAYFEKIEVWSDNEDPDPILVGVLGEQKYLLARWGAESKTFEELKEIAKAKWIKKAKNELNLKIKEVQTKLRDICELAENKLNGEWVYLG